MAHKVIDVTRYRDHYDELSKTPKNYDKDNYFLKELQDKVDAEWPYRPNRVDIEFEATRGTMAQAVAQHGNDKSVWSPIEVVMQTVRSEKGTAISNDCRNIVFQNITEDRFNIGSKFRFAHNFNTSADEAHKNTWLVTNMNQMKLTSSCVIERCNGTLISSYVDAQNITRYHSEPVIQGANLSSTSMFYNDTAVLPQSELLVIAQHNDFIGTYYINQRFIIGYDRVYRIKAINKFYSNSTNDPYDVGVVRIYMELTEKSPYDDFERRIAYQENQTIIDTKVTEDTKYSIMFKAPSVIPSVLDSNDVIFRPVVIDDAGTEYPAIPITVTYSLENLPNPAKTSVYLGYNSGTDASGFWFSLARKKIYFNGPLHVKCSVSAAADPAHKGFDLSFDMSMQ